MIDKLQSHYGSPAPRSAIRSPRGRCTATPHTPKPSPASAGASPNAPLGVITVEVGAGKTVAFRAALAELDQARQHVIYLSNPAVGARGLYPGIVTALGGRPPVPQGRAHPADHRSARRRGNTSGAGLSSCWSLTRRT